ncbi:hypothetical protein GOP47_0009337 [Adiantum capillus-veneris]|uniref:Uncharacterized protein n=1 Tax=Adiantum capillus-veneris TaxID=13818 RepID=A0A9D4UWK5_ADICA|nr:hypothetical protein GOP47_0009337 [Adiantum capillus-veneris]
MAHAARRPLSSVLWQRRPGTPFTAASFSARRLASTISVEENIRPDGLFERKHHDSITLADGGPPDSDVH